MAAKVHVRMRAYVIGWGKVRGKGAEHILVLGAFEKKSYSEI